MQPNWTHGDKSTFANISTSQHKNEPLEKLFLDFESVTFIKEDEDSASDLSDSERIPIPLSPFTPPELNLKAEQIDPGYCYHWLGPEKDDYDYPDFLPPPFSSWNLPQLALFVNTEGKHTLPPVVSGFLERYIDRLLRLEWLQMQTVQNEKSKSRPQTALSMSRNRKSPGKTKPWHTSLPIKQTIHSNHNTKCQENISQKKYFHDEVTTKRSTRWSSTLEELPSVQKLSQEVRIITKKRAIVTCQQNKDLPSVESYSKIQSLGNIRPPKQISFSHAPESSTKLIKSSSKLRSNGNSSHNLSVADRKLKAGPIKVSSCKGKPG
ncbi:protein FAM217B [Pelodytes ibericus]